PVGVARLERDRCRVAPRRLGVVGLQIVREPDQRLTLSVAGRHIRPAEELDGGDKLAVLDARPCLIELRYAFALRHGVLSWSAAGWKSKRSLRRRREWLNVGRGRTRLQRSIR